jgi:hypothetical protein
MRSSSSLAAWLDGWRRVCSAPAVIAGVFAVTLLGAVPLAIAMRAQIDAHLGQSLMADQAADAVNYDWWQEFASQASGLGTTLTPSIIGFAAVLDNVSSVLDARPEQVMVTAALAVYLAAWTFLSGGIIDRYARQRPVRAHGFFAAAGGVFGRFLRLALIAGLLYWFLFEYVHGWLFEDLYPRMTRDLAVEREAFTWRTAFYLVFGALLLIASAIFDYARIRAVVEDRRSVVGSLRASVGFIRRNPGRTIGLHAIQAAAFLALIGPWALIAPGAGSSGPSMWLGFAIAQAYVLARLVLKLQFIAAQTALFQASLAHARYTAAPPRAWPESPAVETI